MNHSEAFSGFYTCIQFPLSSQAGAMNRSSIRFCPRTKFDKRMLMEF